jgi:hypothetical protein
MLDKLLILILFLSSCASSPKEQFSRERTKITHRVVREFVLEMKKSGLDACGISEGLEINNKQNLLGVIFEVNHLPDIEFARCMLVNTLHAFLDRLNREEGIDKYLTEYPFPMRYADIGIISRNSNSGLLSVSNIGDWLYYRKKDPNDPNGPLITVHKETYEEAVKIVNGQKCGCPKEAAPLGGRSPHGAVGAY